MYVTVHFSPQSRGPATDLTLTETVVEQALAADAAGIAAVSLTEHHLGGFNTYCDPILLGCYLAGRLTQAYLAVNIVQVPLRHPVQIVEHCNILDLLTRGRCLITLAPGSHRQIELDAFGVPVGERHERLRQGAEAARRAWSWTDDAGTLDVSTDYHAGLLSARVSPSSFRWPHPLIARGTATAEVVAEAARAGMPVQLAVNDASLCTLYRTELAAAGHPDEIVAECLRWLACIELVCLARTEEAAKAQRERYLQGGGAGPIVSAANEGSQAWVQAWTERARDWGRYSVPVTPQQLVDRVLGYGETHGVEHMIVALSLEPDEPEQNREMLDLFLTEVLPQLDPQQLPGPARTVLTHTGGVAA